jgi:hypothetical protein
MPLRNSLSARSFARVQPDQTAKERQALDQLFSLAYEELRRLARASSVAIRAILSVPRRW